ncbi:winged helix-turn-helix transcriptional regulator [Streptomyces beijiangensis]|uniref:Helix-turn-helix transcriptional regulator n=1 Tax=Streptomyces beijiangensis TaxID=163361 RepID=A0A939JKJ3_9ACTN|nr:helix-turn-helix domain-containing protein [Streptomyces beijiangensis]MBO0515882.1 helix-turn-helix transcriptional regulator [Streptomyces beijiangensis]
MKSYQQYCSVARALDVVGDRWVLLIGRELLALGPSRYSDLKRGLPGIATNLLADRLKVMEAEGLIKRYDAPPPVAATLFELTDRGRGLQSVLHALAEWGLERMTTGPDPEDAVQPQWVALLGGLMLSDRLPVGAEVVVGIESEGEVMRVTLGQEGFAIRRGATSDAAPAPDVTLTGPPQLVGAVLSGVLSPDRATSEGLRITGARRLLHDLVAAPSGAFPQVP